MTQHTLIDRLTRRAELLEKHSTRTYGSRAENTQRRQDALQRLIYSHGVTQTEFARMIGLTNANLIVNFMSGRSHSLSQDTIERILTTFPAVSYEELAGWAGPGEPMLAIEVTRKKGT